MSTMEAVLPEEEVLAAVDDRIVVDGVDVVVLVVLVVDPRVCSLPRDRDREDGFEAE